MSPAPSWWRAIVRGLWLLAGALVAAGLLVLLLGPVAWWATPAKHLTGKDKADARNATRQVLLAAVGGLAVLTGAAFAARTFYLSRRGQLTDRYTKAIAQLASDKLTERLGGIYALEHLMAESERDHHTVVEVLSAFVREETRTLEDSDPDDEGVRAHPATDVQAAVTVLGRQPRRREHAAADLTGVRLYHAELAELRLTNARLTGASLQDSMLFGSSLRGADLSRADASFAVFSRANLHRANLQHACLRHADLSVARLRHARLHEANLDEANLTGADLSYADLSAASLVAAQLQSANLTGAVLTGADLTGALLDTAEGLTPEQLEMAITDGARLPPHCVEAPAPEAF